jgi:hypothetical protein
MAGIGLLLVLRWLSVLPSCAGHEVVVAALLEKLA